MICEPLTIANSLVGLAMLRHAVSIEDTVSLLAAMHTLVVKGSNPHASSAACVAAYGAVCMWIDNPEALSALYQPCASLVANLSTEGVMLFSAAQLLHANEAMAMLGPGALLDAHAVQRWQELAESRPTPRPLTSQLTLHDAAQMLLDTAQALTEQENHMQWATVDINVPMLPGMKHIDVVLTSVDPSCKVAVMLTGSWDSFCNQPSVVTGSTHLHRMLLAAHGYAVVAVDVDELMMHGTDVSRAAWLLSLVTDTLAA